MKKCMIWMSALFLLSLCTVCFAAGLDGTWESERQGPQGQTMKQTYVFKTDGNKLTGTISGGRGGDQEITNGVVNGNDFSFTVVRNFNGNEMKMNYKGKVSGDEFTMTMEMEGGFPGGGMGGPPGGAPPGGGMGGGGGRGGGPRGPMEITAKRVK
jgi:hypothetical protein